MQVTGLACSARCMHATMRILLLLLLLLAGCSVTVRNAVFCALPILLSRHSHTVCTDRRRLIICFPWDASSETARYCSCPQSLASRQHTPPLHCMARMTTCQVSTANGKRFGDRRMRLTPPQWTHRRGDHVLLSSGRLQYIRTSGCNIYSVR